MKIMLAVIVLAIGGTLLALRFADGPTQFIAGGELKTGEWATQPVEDWSFIHAKNVELQLVEPTSSRITGIMVHDGELYIPCDLGFMWNRLSGRSRWVLNAIYLFKGWHEDALDDGRMVFRYDNKKYARQAVLVEDPVLIEELKQELEQMAAEYFAPRELGPRPVDDPNDIWFFRLDSRDTAAVQAQLDSVISLPEVEGGSFRTLI